MGGVLDANELSREEFKKLFERGVSGVPKTESVSTINDGEPEKKKKKKKNKKGNGEDAYRELAVEDESAGKITEVEKKEEEKGISPDDLDLARELEAVQQTIQIEDEMVKEKSDEGDSEVPLNQSIEEKIKERFRVANPRYQKARLHYLGHRFNLIHPDKTGLLVADDNDDFNVGRLRLVEDLLRITNGEGDLREAKDRLIAVGVYVKDLENLSERIKPMFQKREELLQKFYDEGSKEELELLEKEIGEVFGVEIMYERIKSGERAQPRKELEKKASDGVLEEVKENSSGYFYSDLLFDDLYLLEFGSEDEKKEAKIRLEKEGVKIKDNETTYDHTFMVMALEDIKKRDFKRWSKDPQKAKSFVRRMLFLEKKPEGKSENKGIEPQYYDELYQDLWNAEYGEEAEKIKSQERLISNNILPVEFGTDEVAKETYRMALEAIRSNKFVAWHNKREEAENYIKKIHGLKESAGGEKKENTAPAVETVEVNKNIEYLDYLGNDLLVDMDRVYAGKDENGKWKYEENVSKVAMDRMTKMGLRLVMMPRKGDKGEIPHFRRGQRAINRISDFLDGKEINREELNYFNSDLRAMGIKKEDLDEARKRKLERDKGKVQGDGEKVGGGGGEENSVETENIKKKQKELVFDEKEMLREFGEFVKLNGGRTDVWNKWLEDLNKVQEQKKREVIGQLKYTWDLLKNSELRLNDQHFPFWQKYAMAYLRSLGVNGKV